MAGPKRRTHAARKAETRAKLVKATIDEINRKGVAGLRTKEIAASAGVSWGAAQHLFGDKTELLLYVVEDVTNRIIEHRLLAIDRRAPLRERIESIVEESWKTHRTPEAQAVTELTLAKRSEPELLKRQLPLIRAAEDKMLAAYCELFDDTNIAEEKIRTVHDVIALTMSALARREHVLLHNPTTVKSTVDLLKEMLCSVLIEPSPAPGEEAIPNTH